MAKRAGFEDREDAKELGKKPPGVGHNVTQEVFLKAAAQMAQLNQERQELNARINAERKQMKANGIELGAMDAMLKMAEWDRGEIREAFDLRRRYAEWLNLPIGTQTDLFKGMEDDEIQAREWHATGLQHKRAGRARSLPDHCPEQFIQFYDRGYDEKQFVWTRVEKGSDPAPAKPPKGAKEQKPGKDKRAPEPKRQDPVPPGEGDSWPDDKDIKDRVVN